MEDNSNVALAVMPAQDVMERARGILRVLASGKSGAALIREAMIRREDDLLIALVRVKAEQENQTTRSALVFVRAQMASIAKVDQAEAARREKSGVVSLNWTPAAALTILFRAGLSQSFAVAEKTAKPKPNVEVRAARQAEQGIRLLEDVLAYCVETENEKLRDSVRSKLESMLAK